MAAAKTGGTPTTSQEVLLAHQSNSNVVGTKVVEKDATAVVPAAASMIAEPKFTDHPHFKVSIETLQQLTDDRNLALLDGLGGVEGLVEHLHTDMNRGLSFDEDLNGPKNTGRRKKHDFYPEGHDLTAFESRRDAYGTNFIPPTAPPSLLSLMWEALHDRILVMLQVAGVIEISVGIYLQVSGEEKNHWIEGVAIVITVIIVVMVNSINDYRKAKQFRFLSTQKHLTSLVTVIRHGKNTEPAQTTISVIHLQVGEIVHLNTGDIVPADGVFISGHNCKVDESSVTGETDAVTKSLKKDRFFISGSKVIDGIATYIVTAVGRHSLNGRTTMALRTSSPLTPLQIKLGDLAEKIGKLGILIAIVIVLASLIIYLVRKASGFKAMTGIRIFFDILRIFIIGITVVVVAVPEGLPMAVTLALGYATRRMLKDNNLVRVLAACETMGGATTICSDKTGTLTQNKMTVVQGTMFDSVSFETIEQIRDRLMNNPFSTQQKGALTLLTQVCNINSTAYEGTDDTGKKAFTGSKTECALLEFTALLNSVFSEDRAAAEIVFLLPFSSERKRMSTVIHKLQSKDPKITFNIELPLSPELQQTGVSEGPEGECKPPVRGEARCFVKGASEYILESCEYYVDEKGQVAALTDKKRAFFNDCILAYAGNALRTIGIAYKDIPAFTEPPVNLDTYNLIFIGLVGIEDPLRTEVPPAIAKCQAAGIVVRMVTGDNPVTAENIAKRCGILAEGGLVMEGAKFRMLSDAEMRKTIPRLCVLARSSPLDKRVLVNKLKEMGEIVAVTGDGTNDGPALKAADVGFAMGIAGTGVAKEASDIILMDDNFASLTKAVMWGRSVNDAIRKFLQFQLTVNITALILVLISVVSDSEQRPVISALQMLWVNMIMDTFAAVALATDPPTMEMLDRKPHKKSDPIISYDMWKQILGQATFQIIVLCLFNFMSPQFFGFTEAMVEANQTAYYTNKDKSPHHYVQNRKSAVVFNVFVFMQVFNMFNGRMIYGEYNVFRRIFKNRLFFVILAIIVIMQVIIIFFIGEVLSETEPISGNEWAATVLTGAISLPIGVLIKVLPDVGRKWFQSKFYAKDQTDATRQWHYAMHKVQTQITVLRVWRGYSGEKKGVMMMD